jgi:hypothetical protein
MSEIGLTGIAALEAEMRDRLRAKDAEIERLGKAVAQRDDMLADAMATAQRLADQMLKAGAENDELRREREQLLGIIRGVNMVTAGVLEKSTQVKDGPARRT